MLFWLLWVGTTTREKASVPRAMSPLMLGALAIQRPARPWSSMSISITWPLGRRGRCCRRSRAPDAARDNAATHVARPVRHVVMGEL